MDKYRVRKDADGLFFIQKRVGYSIFGFWRKSFTTKNGIKYPGWLRFGSLEEVKVEVDLIKSEKSFKRNIFDID